MLGDDEDHDRQREVLRTVQAVAEAVPRVERNQAGDVEDPHVERVGRCSTYSTWNMSAMK